ncbi:MAG: Hsp33 family molecular chaperone HslO [Peptostreptococcaceae bacterium]|jgi:molecular chaperone Hsp33|nr:Hsp33 family molecular chaperone HslO [Peptostreptococcaceae bacterium]
MDNYVLRGADKGLNVRIFAAKTTNMVEKARKIHNTTPLASAALGRSLTAGAIMGLMLKGEKDKLTLQIKGDGPINSIVIVANSKGITKGYVSNPSVDLPLNEKGKLDVSKAVGEGKLTVIKDLNLKEPYVGKSNLVNGEIAEDLTAYFTYSEQQPSAVALGVLVDRDYSIMASGGFILQVMPNAEDEVLSTIENNLRNVSNISKLISIGKEPEDIINMVLDGLDPIIFEKKEIDYKCDCSKDRLEKALIAIGEKDLREILEEDKKAELTCHFCNTSYTFDEKDLKDILKRVKA